MWRKDGTNIIVALGQMSKKHRDEMDAASAHLATNIPSGVDIERLVVQTCGAREWIHRCLKLRDELSMANFEKRSLTEVLQNSLQAIEAEEVRRRRIFEEGEGENLGADHIERVSLQALCALRDALLEFNTVPPVELKLARQ